jgi:hypothetical protein
MVRSRAFPALGRSSSAKEQEPRGTLRPHPLGWARRTPRRLCARLRDERSGARNEITRESWHLTPEGGVHERFNHDVM